MEMNGQLHAPVPIVKEARWAPEIGKRKKVIYLHGFSNGVTRRSYQVITG
jgi:hypothetical protein